LAVLLFGSVFGSFGLVEHLVKIWFFGSFGSVKHLVQIWSFGHLVEIWFFWLFGSVLVKLRQPPR
jgi:hypothetical protein